MSRLVLHIDRLVLHGIDPQDAQALVSALQAELQRQLGTNGEADALAALRGIVGRSRIKAPPLRIARSAPPETLGRALAGPILRGVKS